MGNERTDDIRHLKDVAAEWILRQHSGEWTEADAIELQRWIQAATTNRIAYLRAQAAWTEASRLRSIGVDFEPGVAPDSEESSGSA